MKTILIFFFSAIVFNVQSQTSNLFTKLKFDKVVMYDFEGGKGHGILSIVDENGKLATTVSKQIQLNKETITQLNTKLESKRSYGCATAACFDPHLGFVYYLKDKIIAHITICLDCNRLYSSIDIKAQKQCKTGNGKDIYYLCDGMSKSFRQFLINIMKKNKFSHQTTAGNCY